MDCNSYSYAPTMLDGERNMLAKYENDDMQIELEQVGARAFTVWAFSYDGSMDVSEEFSDRAPAEQLYRFIRDSYSNTPPGDELEAYIAALPGRYGGAA